VPTLIASPSLHGTDTMSRRRRETAQAGDDQRSEESGSPIEDIKGNNGDSIKHTTTELDAKA